MRKNIILGILTLALIFLLAGCWNGEIHVKTTFNRDGSGERIIILDVVDEFLSESPIQKKDKTGNVENNKYIEGGVIAIQTWLEANKPDVLTLHPMETVGTSRHFKLSYTFDDWDDFINKYKILVNLSTEFSWDGFDEAVLPTRSVEGNKTTIIDSRDVLKASIDWAIAGIWNDIYKQAEDGAANNKNAMYDLFNITLKMETNTYEIESYYDEEAGAMVHVPSQIEHYEISFEYPISVVFDLNGGKIGESIEPVIIEVEKGTAIAAEDVPADPTREGFEFKYWATSKTSTESYDFETLVEEELTLFAVWESTEVEEVSVVFNLDGGVIGTSTDDITVTVNKNNVIPAASVPANPTKEGFDFKHWSSTQNGTEAFDLTSVISADITLYAVWSKKQVDPPIEEPIEKVSVTYKLEGGKIGTSEADVVIEVEKGKKIPISSHPANPTKEGVMFKHWSSTKEGATGFNFDQVVDNDLVLYAVYTAIDAEEKPKSNLSTGVIIAIIAGSVAIVGAGAWFLFFRKK